VILGGKITLIASFHWQAQIIARVKSVWVQQ